MSKCSKNSIPSTVSLSTQFTIELDFGNNGPTAWPESTRLIQVSGPRLHLLAANDAIGMTLEPGKGLKFQMKVLSPAQPGKYTCFYRLCHSDQKIEFGEKVWAEFEVVQQKDEVSLFKNPYKQE